MEEKKITKNMVIGELIKKYPQSIEVLTDQGFHCVGCHVATWETLEQGAQAHGIDINKLVDGINDKIKIK